MKKFVIMAVMMLTALSASARAESIVFSDTLSIEQLDEQAVRRDSLCRKYGKEYGPLLAENRIDLGMTEEMCQVVLDRRCFIIRSAMDDDGDRFEEWTFDLEKTILVLADTFEDKQMMLMLMANLEQMSSGAFSKQLQDLVPYKFLKFKNGILVEFLENA